VINFFQFAFNFNLRRYNLGGKDYVELASLKVQGLAYRTRPGEYFMSNLLFGTVTASGDPGRIAGHRVSFSYNTDDDTALREVQAGPRHSSPLP
jgi:hypothetical protein